MTCLLTVNNPSILARFLDTTVNPQKETESPHLYKWLFQNVKEARYEEFSSNDPKRSFDIYKIF